MLVMFRYKNFGPFKDEAVFDMRAVKSYKEHPYNLITTYEDLPLLKVAAIYGANASGKSNFVDAYYCFLKIVRTSFQDNNKEDSEEVLETYYNSFLLDESAYEDTEFEATFRDGNYEIRYGFIYDESRIKYEWLYRTNLTTKRSSVILEREESDIELGDSVKRSCAKYLPEIDTDVLALSFFSSLKLKTTAFAQTMSCVMRNLPARLSHDGMAEHMLNSYWLRDFDEIEKPKLLKFLHGIDVGIKDIEVEKNKKRVEVTTYHIGANSELCPMPLELESDGTRRAIALYSVLRIAAKAGTGLIIDEFHLIDLFCEESEEGQLIYTTHDTSLLDKKYMRRDQVWFVEKNENGESSLYSLADFKVRNDASFEKDYLGGVYGGIPNLKDFSFGEE